VVVHSRPEAAQAAYRRALGRFPTGVAFVATQADGRTAGLLINSFTSVSLDPPLIMWCLGLASRCRSAFLDGSTFAVSVLAQEQKSMIGLLSRPLEKRFEGIAIRNGIGSAPIIEGAAAVFECRTFSISRAGDHDLILGLVEKFTTGAETPLACLNGRFGGVHIPSESTHKEH
jgi:4-hydroxyphenylacetate 3-hydroxylase, reductase component